MQVNAPVGIIGLGLMGTALSERLIAAGAPVVGFDIEASSCDKLQASGGMAATSVRDLAGRTWTILVAVYNGPQVEALFAEIESGAGSARPTLVCATTCTPDEIIRLARHATSAGFPLVEAEHLSAPAPAYLVHFIDVRFLYPDERRRPLQAYVLLDSHLQVESQGFETLKAQR